MSVAVVLWLLFALLLAFGAWRLLAACRRANLTDWGSGWLNLLDGLNRLFCRYYHRMPEVRLDLPGSGPAVVVSNHVSGLDPLLLIAAARRPLRFLIAREQYQRFGLQWLFRAVGCIPVDREGRPEQALREAMRAIDRGEVVALFPQGRIHAEQDGRCHLKPGAARVALHAGCPIHPARIGDIAGTGMVLRGVAFRSRVSFEPGTPIPVAGRELKQIQGALREAVC